MVTEKALSPALLFREADEMGWVWDLGPGRGFQGVSAVSIR